MPFAVRIRRHCFLLKGIAPLLFLLCGACVPHQTERAPVALAIPAPAPATAPATAPISTSTVSPAVPEEAEKLLLPAEPPLLLEDLEGPVATLPTHYESSASYYAKRFNGRRTFTGERYDPDRMTAATRDFPLQSWLRVINPANGKEVTVRINDLTGKRKTPRIDLSRAAAKELGFFGKGKIHVHVIPLPLPPLLSANLSPPE